MVKEIEVSNGLYFVNVGEVTPDDIPRRNWKACYTYGFLSAGQSIQSIKQIVGLGLKKDAVVAAYISRRRDLGGYVGIGIITSEKAIRLKDFALDDGRKLRGLDFIIDNGDYGPGGLFENSNNELSEYVIKVKWEKWVDEKRYAFFKSGVFTYESVKADLSNNLNTRSFLEEKFKIKFK